MASKFINYTFQNFQNIQFTTSKSVIVAILILLLHFKTNDPPIVKAH